MKIINYLSITFLLFSLSAFGAQKDSTSIAETDYPVRKLTIEPGIGINPYPMPDMLISGLVQWNITNRWSVLSFSSYSYNNAFQREFNYIKTNYNYSISQKFGIGFSLYTENTSHMFSFIAGIKYETFKETLENPEFENVSASISTVNPDLGLMYNFKIGRGGYFLQFKNVYTNLPIPD
ncbi:MAG: hypothetical protein MZV63_11860 [Marinilabiliales bacterium]|nr:hypothetical protein [Marinilabiliales bacterium]